MLILHGCVVAFTRLHWFWWRFFHRFIWFCCFFRMFSITPFNIYLLSLLWMFLSLEGLGDVWSIRSESSGILTWRVLGILCSSRRIYSSEEFDGLLNRLVVSLLFITYCVYQHIHITSTQISYFYTPCACRTWNDLYPSYPEVFLPIVGLAV